MKQWIWVGAVALVSACAGDDAATAVIPVEALSPSDAYHRSPAYSPDGTQLAYWIPDSAGSAASFRLVVADASNSRRQALEVTTLNVIPVVWSPDGRRIAASASNFGVADVLVINADGTGLTRVTESEGLEAPVVWHRDGDRLSYFATTDRTVESFVVRVSTGERRPLVPAETVPYFGALAPDGSHVIYQRLDGGKFTIWYADSLGEGRRPLTTEGFEDLGVYFFWSPDSKEIVYRSRRTGTYDIWVAPVDGSAARQLTRDVRNDIAAAWSPDGQWVAFLSDRGRQTDLWVVPAAGGEEIRVTDDVAEELNTIVWVPGTAQLTYVVNSDAREVVQRVIASGASTVLVADTVGVRANIKLSPDGTLVAYRIASGGSAGELVVTPVAGGAARTLVSNGASIANPRWSPDGSRIAYQSNRTGSSDLYIVDVASGVSRAVAEWPTSGEFTLSWEGDGRTLLFVSERDSRYGDVWRVPATGGEPTRVTKLGNVDQLQTGAGFAGAYLLTYGEADGRLTVVRLRADDSVVPIAQLGSILSLWVSPSGDSVVAGTVLPSGEQVMVLNAGSEPPKRIGQPNDLPLAWSRDGASIVFQRSSGGTSDLWSLELATGLERRITSDAAIEASPGFAAGDTALVFEATRTISRMMRADLSTRLPQRQ
jgi:Tol biopolymer transport system component